MLDAATQYAAEVDSGKIVVCKWVKLAARRHLDDLEKSKSPDYPYEFDITKAERFWKFTKLIRHYKGDYRGKRLELLPWQLFITGCLYGWVEKGTGRFRFTDAYIEVPRKNGKSFLAAAIALYDMAFLDGTGSEVYLAATKLDQAKLIYKDVCAIIRGSKELKDHFEILSGTNIIYAKATHRTSFIQPLGSDSKRLDGLNPFTAIFDEVHAIEDRNIVDVIQGAFGARTNYHTVSITTAGVNREGVCYEIREQITKILDGLFSNERRFGIIYSVDAGEERKWDDPKVWAKANPSLGAGKELSYLQKMCEDAKQIPSTLTDFLTKQLNVWVDAKSAWLNVTDWNRCEEDFPTEKLKGKKCFVGMDLARVSDFSALTLVFPQQPGLEKPHVISRSYLPQESLKTVEHQAKAPFSNWVKMGLITITPGNITDFDYIERDVIEFAKTYQIQELTYDRYFSGELITKLTKEGIRCEGFPQNTVSMNPPTMELERLIKSKGIVFQKNPLLAWQASNVELFRDSSGNAKPDKAKNSNKIDAVVCLIMALGRELMDRTTAKPVDVNAQILKHGGLRRL